MSELVVKGGTVIDATGGRRADVLVRDGIIVEVGEDLDASTALDASGCIVAPGLVDLHAHLREPGFEDAEDIGTGARAAALGGYTAIVAMPNTDPPIDTAAVDTARDAVQGFVVTLEPEGGAPAPTGPIVLTSTR